MNFCFLCNEYPPASHGGIGVATRTLARALVSSGHRVRVIGFTFRDENVPEFEFDEGVFVRRLKMKKSRFAWIRARRLVYRTVSEWAHAGLIDIVEAPDYEGPLAGWPALPVPVVARLHGSSSYFAREMNKAPRKLTFFLERASLRRADFLCSCSLYAAEKTQSMFRLGTIPTVLYNGVTLSEASSETVRSPATVVFSGTLTEKKGVISLIRAWALVHEKHPLAELHIFGKDGRTHDGKSMQRFLESCLPESALAKVRFHGHVGGKRLRAAFQTARVAVFPSFSEAFALAPMESMAEGCATIYSHRSSGTELIEDGKTGLLVDPAQPKDIADSIVKLLEDSPLAEKLGSAGKKSIETRFAPSALLRKNLDFYFQCAGKFRLPERKAPATSYCLTERASK